MQVRRLATGDAGFEQALEALLAFEAAQDPAVERATAEILDAVKARGDAALVELTARFDRWTPASAGALEIPQADAKAALASLGPAEREALAFAAGRIRAYHEHQRLQSWRYEEPDGTVLGQKITRARFDLRAKAEQGVEQMHVVLEELTDGRTMHEPG